MSQPPTAPERAREIIEHSALTTEEIQINMGPQHPSTHGVLRLILKLDGEWIHACDPDIGFLHRSFEKLAELKTYLNGIPLTDRWDYLSAMSNNLVYCQATERLMGLEVPERAQYLRMIVCELNRIASHLVFVGTYGLDVGAMTPFLYCFRDREFILDLFEEICGARLTYNYLRPGGVSADCPGGWLERVQQFVEYLPPMIDEIDALLTHNEIFILRTEGIACISREQAIQYALTGPMLRASGVARDIRRADPYLQYDQVEFDIPVGQRGDNLDRYRVRVAEIRQSLKIIAQCLQKIPDGPVMAKVSKILRPPPGECYTSIESPRGELGLHLVSDGTERPYRMKIRRPSFVNLAVLPEIAVGLKVADLVMTLGSTDIVMGEVDG